MSDVKETVVEVWAEEKVNVGNYSNVTIGSRISKTFVIDVDESVEQKVLADIVEQFVAEERQAILKSVQGKE